MTHYWITKDGRKLVISEMNDEHIVNTYKFLLRVAEKIKNEDIINIYENHVCENMSDMEISAIDMRINGIKQKSLHTIAEEHWPIINQIQKEIRLRNINL